MNGDKTTLSCYIPKVQLFQGTSGLFKERAKIWDDSGHFFSVALPAAFNRDHEKVVQQLLDPGADVNMQNGRYGTALIAASENGHEKVV